MEIILTRQLISGNRVTVPKAIIDQLEVEDGDLIEFGIRRFIKKKRKDNGTGDNGELY
ncbi:hypothetical protein [Candidatus Borrarchaeum sp.]|uniref:hypothetical protein n=1 Tax=Candidatus Borrarchaeum sp. TaxID=2846742 RepID=UPI00257B81B9|nr:hypothetical protein [Candidatus Borrarchaeum sp.]